MADHFYISPANGNDSNGGTSEVTAKATIQAALDLTATTPNATVFHLGNSGDHNVSTSLFWTNGNGTKWNYTRPPVFMPWDEGASGVNYRTINGIATPEAVINLTTTGDLWPSTENPNYCTWLNTKIICDGSAGTNGTLYLGQYSFADGIIIHNSDASYALRGTTGSTFINCAITSDGTYYPDRAFSVLNSLLINCLAEGAKLDAVQYATFGMYNCTIKNWGISNSVYNAVANNAASIIKNCNFIGNNSSGGNAKYALESTTNMPYYYNNIFMDLETGFEISTSFDSGAQFVGNNAYYMVTNKYTKDAPPQAYGWDTAAIIDLTHRDIILTEDPFVDQANNDYRLKANSPCIGRGMVLETNYAGVSPVSSPPLRCDIGAVQTGNAGLPYVGVRS